MDHTVVGLQSAIRALTDVVAPVVSPEHAQAVDQLRLTVNYLSFVVERLPHLHQRARFELRHSLDMASAVQLALEPPSISPLPSLIKAGQGVLDDAESPMAAVQQAAANLSAALAQAVRDAAGLDGPVRGRVERSVLRASLQRIAFERAWYLPLRLDPDPHEVRPLSDFLATGQGLSARANEPTGDLS